MSKPAHVIERVGERAEPGATLVHGAAFAGIAILVITTAVSPNGAAVAIAFLGPVFIPALVGVVLAVVPRGRNVHRTVGAALMMPGFALATLLSAGYSPEASDHPAQWGSAAASLIDVIGPLGGLMALSGLVIAALRRSGRSGSPWVAIISVSDLLVVAVALSAAKPG